MERERDLININCTQSVGFSPLALKGACIISSVTEHLLNFKIRILMKNHCKPLFITILLMGALQLAGARAADAGHGLPSHAQLQEKLKAVVSGGGNAGFALNMWATHTTTAGDLSTFTPAQRVKASGQTQFFPWLQSAPNGRVDLVYYDRSCDPNDVLNCVTLSSSTDTGASWVHVAVTTAGFGGDTFGACLAFVDPPDCKNFFLGDYIAVASTNTKAQTMWTGNGSNTLDAFTAGVGF